MSILIVDPEQEAFEAYLDRWMEVQGRPQHSTVLEIIATAAHEFYRGAARPFARYMEDYDAALDKPVEGR